MGKIDPKKMIIIDLGTGRYLKTKIGYEIYNLEKNLDGNFYGSCPPVDSINIDNFGIKNGDRAEGVLVVYVTKKENSSNREIIAFCENATVFKDRQSGEGLNRAFEDTDGTIKIAAYSIKSSNLYDLRDRFNKFEIRINSYSNKMFRKQRIYAGKYPELDAKIISYIEGILENKEILDKDDTEEQEEIQRAEPATTKEIQESSKKPLNIVSGSQSEGISKNSKISKAALRDVTYTCQIDSNHKTFTTKQNVPYMEGHHLIPCTLNNSKEFESKYNKNIDCYENIVCLCPNCHRAVHFGDWKTKEEKIKIMYTKQRAKLQRIGITITEEELLKLYK